MSWERMRWAERGVRWEKVWMTESGGTTGMSFCISEERFEKMCVERLREGDVMRAYGDSAQRYWVCGYVVRAWRQAGMRVHEVGEGDVMCV